MSQLGRELLQLVEIDIDQCTRTYGSSPCTATLSSSNVRKCYNTFFTCQDTANFNAGTLTLRFAHNQAGLPKGQTVFPALRSVSTNAASINLGGVDRRKGPLGKRARVQVQLQDFAYHDTYTDPYASGRRDGTAQNDEGKYDPETRGTFFGKLRRRFPYYIGRALRVKEGTVGQDVASMRTRHYVISEWVGPDAQGRVTITAKDVLDLADNDKALCPTPNEGALGRDIGADEAASDGLTFALAVDNTGSDYSASGRIVIGREIMTFVRVNDTFTITARGVDGTKVSSHSQGDTVQECYRVENVTVDNVLTELLEDFAGVPSSFIPSSDWSYEAGRWLPSLKLTATIAKPTGVTDLLAEICAHGVLVWWDDVAQEIKLKASNRPLDLTETAPALSDASTFIAGSMQRQDLHDQRLSKVLFYHGIIDATDGLSGENFRKAYVATDLEAETDTEYGQPRARFIFSRWLGDGGNDLIARGVATRTLRKFRDTPQMISFAVDVKDKDNVDVAALVKVTSRLLQDETGNSVTTDMVITSQEETVGGHKLAIAAQSSDFTGRFGFITGNFRPNYASSTDAQKAKGVYFVDETTLEFGDGTGPYILI